MRFVVKSFRPHRLGFAGVLRLEAKPVFVLTSELSQTLAIKRKLWSDVTPSVVAFALAASWAQGHTEGGGNTYQLMSALRLSSLSTLTHTVTHITVRAQRFGTTTGASGNTPWRRARSLGRDWLNSTWMLCGKASPTRRCDGGGTNQLGDSAALHATVAGSHDSVNFKRG